MRFLVLSSLAWLCFVGLLPGLCLAQETAISAKHHPWGRFETGAWRQTRVVIDTLDENGRVASTSTTETIMTLAKIGKGGVTLNVEVCFEVDGNRFGGEPKTVEQGFHGEVANGALKIVASEDGHVTIGGQKIPCKTLRLESSKRASKTSTTVYYSPTVAPYILKRESSTTDLEEKTVLRTTQVDAMALDVRQRVLGETKSCALVRAVNTHAKGTIFTLAFTSPEVPGGIVWHDLKEFDENGRLVRHSTLELIGYGAVSAADRTGLLGRRRLGLIRKSSTRRAPD